MNCHAQGAVACQELWARDFGPRSEEIVQPRDRRISFGVCRCLPGVTDGSFEYIAEMEAIAQAPVPSGMMEVILPESDYAVFEVNGLEHVGQGQAIFTVWQEANPGREGYCTPTSCNCATHPSFELYPSSFPADGRLSIYFPVRRSTAG